MTFKDLTPERLERLVAAGDLEGIAKATESMTEPERKKLSKTAGKLYTVLNKAAGFGVFDLKESDKAFLQDLNSRIDGEDACGYGQQCVAAHVAVLAVCPFSKARRIAWRRSIGPETDAVFKILSDRRPDWIDQWVDERLEQRMIGIRWDFLRRLMQAGVCTKPSGDGYTRLLVRDFPSSIVSARLCAPLTEKLLHDEGLLEDEVWRLFKVETEAFTFTMEWEERLPRVREGHESWATALCELSQSGAIDRQRLLTACLEGLTTGFKNDVLSGYIRLYERLNPKPEEEGARQQTYLALLSSSAGHVVTFALKVLKAIAKHGALDDNAFLASAAPAMTSRTKGHPKGVMAMLEGIVKRDSGKRGPAALLLTEALAHEAPDVQQRAFDLLEKWAEPGDASLKDALTERLDDIAASQRSRVEALMDRLGGAAAPEPELAPAATDGWEEMLDRVSALSPEIRRIAGVDDAVAALDNGTLPPLQFTMVDAAVLTGVEPITPIADVDELIDAVAHGVETVDSADEVERIFDGISRLCDQRPADFERRTEPLVKRIEEFTNPEIPVNWQGLVAYSIQDSMGGMLFAWLRPHQAFTEYPTGGDELPSLFLRARVKEVARRARKGQSYPLLAAPTHAHGWIDPRVLVERIKTADDFQLEKHRYDLLQALIRLAPNHRADALADASTIEGDVGRIVRWALGGPDGPTDKDKKPSAAFWLAAGRARAPHRRLDELAEYAFDDPGPDGIEPARYAWNGVPDRSNRWQSIDALEPAVSRSPELRKMPSPADWPTAASHDRLCWRGNTGWLIDWMGMLWPQNADGLFASGIHALALSIESNASTHSPNYVFLRPLVQRDRPWREMARLAALLGLAGRDADARGYAMDALAEGIADGRAHPEELGEALVLLTREPAIKLNRITEGMQEVARISDVHAYVIAQVLAFWLRNQEALPKGAHHALEPLLELLTQCGIPLDDKARKPLEGLKGSSKTAKLAKRLLAHAPANPERQREQFMLTLLEARINRAERWQEG